MQLYLDVLKLEDMELIREWRNKHLGVLRTPYLLTFDMQKDFYKSTVSDRDSKARYWALRIPDGVEVITNSSFAEERPPTVREHLKLIGCGGIENIEWENRLGEVSLLISPDYQRQGYGSQALNLLLDQAFNKLNLETIYAEVYKCNEQGLAFWHKMASQYNATFVQLPRRKYWEGKYWDSVYFTFVKEKDYDIRNKM